MPFSRYPDLPNVALHTLAEYPPDRVFGDYLASAPDVHGELGFDHLTAGESVVEDGFSQFPTRSDFAQRAGVVLLEPTRTVQDRTRDANEVGISGAFRTAPESTSAASATDQGNPTDFIPGSRPE